MILLQLLSVKLLLIAVLSVIKSYALKFVDTVLAILFEELRKVKLFCFKANELSIKIIIIIIICYTIVSCRNGIISSIYICL